MTKFIRWDSYRIVFSVVTLGMLVEFSGSAGTDEVLLDSVVKKYFQMNSQQMVSSFIRLPAFCIPASARSKEESIQHKAEKEPALSGDGRLFLNEFHFAHRLSDFNVVEIASAGDLLRIDFEEDLSSPDYDGVVGRLWIDIENKKAIKREMWVSQSESVKKHREDKLRRLKIKRGAEEAMATTEKKVETEEKTKGAK